ncbi:hypothetical protein E4T52_01220 [Aureobasidium sp. EXF-3400]|nr:hypothetical protein E4T51_00541 [Aureobasidium sp. EXF-12344]KAI4783950.1 hypothetical protein E4T52_01220 [Aureobasidium sp. EXF-3400]
MATTLQPSFGLQQPEDSMEISSEYGNNMDADIDIDLDAPEPIDTNMQSFQVDDHQMQEDPRSDRPDDLLMIDDSNLDDTDRMMQDDAPLPQEQDEELLDFSEDEEDVPMNPAEPTQPDEIDLLAEPEIPVNQPATIQEPVELVQSDMAAELLTEGVQPVNTEVPQPEEASEQPHVEHVETQEPVTTETVTNDELQLLAQTSPDKSSASAPQLEPQEDTQPSLNADSAEQSETYAQETVVESTENANVINENPEECAQVVHQSPAEDQHLEQGNDDIPTGVAQEHDEQPIKRTLTRQETDLSNYTVPDDLSREREVNSPTVTGLHPTIVEYQENEVYLFPSRDPAVPEQYLLQNENLVTTSLGDLLQACRTALGDGISEDEELVLGVEELDLYVSEDSTPAFSTSFSELLDIYLQLHKLDGNDNPPPFRVSLTTKVRFSNRLASITQAISEGKGFSQLSFLQYYEYDEPTELPDEDFDDDFDELAKLEEPQKLIEEGATTVESAQDVAEDEHTAEDVSAPQAEDQQPESTGSAQEGEYEGETVAQHDLPTDTADQSEYNQDDTQYFDAQGGESELLDESHVEQEDVVHAEAQSATGIVEAEVEDGSHHEDQIADGAVHAEDVSEHNEHEEHFEHHAEEQHEYETQGEEQVFGQGEFFDENYEYQDGEVHDEDEEGAYVAEEEAANNDGHNEDEQEFEASAAGEQDENVSPSSGETLQGDQPEIGQNDDDTQQNHGSAEQSADNGVADAEHDSGPVDAAAATDKAKRPSLAVEDDDYDEINFDDEDSYDGDGVGLEPVLTNASSKASPGAKRSFSELDQVDDEQDSKKARAS